eukprot:CAMPEP_0184321420 /NCGR_PEP_ID=MMETSP1049-20130417/118997_1 /TAXON_ID=77928 /ORGANISM="Proteomonas sulcata, Strain CCMP704" /LENGTH=73 /DNA_ID=CAMNT_0026642225 /DNA_START=1 /DNA_END=219 /DNA_ORIENTATION=+
MAKPRKRSLRGSRPAAVTAFKTLFGTSAQLPATLAPVSSASPSDSAELSLRDEPMCAAPWMIPEPSGVCGPGL